MTTGDGDLARALAALLALGLATAATVVLGAAVPAALAAALLLVLAGLKAEVILARYLALAAAPEWLRGFRGALALLLAALYALYLAPLLS